MSDGKPSFFYDAETDSLLIRLQEGEYADSREISPDVVVDFDTAGQPLAIDIQHASYMIKLDETDSTGKPTIESLLGANETLQKEIDSLRHRLRELTRIQAMSSGRY